MTIELDVCNSQCQVKGTDFLFQLCYLLVVVCFRVSTLFFDIVNCISEPVVISSSSHRTKLWLFFHYSTSSPDGRIHYVFKILIQLPIINLSAIQPPFHLLAFFRQGSDIISLCSLRVFYFTEETCHCPEICRYIVVECLECFFVVTLLRRGLRLQFLLNWLSLWCVWCRLLILGQRRWLVLDRLLLNRLSWLLIIRLALRRGLLQI
mmetsp:Transcript_5187/g.11461  ORF Transcript_5187/g.11461 Transcript_5187/m.11461 type:complete len:207 (+) Transcript_5187:1452-2072(+)